MGWGTPKARSSDEKAWIGDDEMGQREHRLSSKIMKELRLKGAFCFKAWGNDAQMAGLPDIIGVIDGMFFGIEVKNPESRGNVSAIQQLRMQQIKDANGSVTVVCSVQEALTFISMVKMKAESHLDVHPGDGPF